jgi:site-specific DNA-methyltransferase (adenine-specific)
MINEIFNEDCLETMKKMPDNFIDLTVTSPPYDGLRLYKGYSFDFENIAKELFRVTKKGGVVIWVVGDQTKNGSESGTSFKQALYFKEVGFNLHDTMIYEKLNYVPLTHNRYEQCFEYMFCLSKGKPKTFNPILIPCKNSGKTNNHKSEKHYEDSHSMRKRDGLVQVNEFKIHPNKFIYPIGSGDKTKHNAPFPETLTNDQIISWSNEGDLVYDPFMGSGTVAKMSILNNRNYIGSEISEEYCLIIKNRIEKTLMELTNKNI